MSYGVSLKNEEEYKREAEKIADQFEAKLRKTKKGLRFTNDLIALFSYMTDPEVHWAKKTVVVAALLYFIIPFDAIPDFAPVAGYLDDIGVVGAAIKYLGSQLNRYYLV
ncbi:MAG: YkvA family protein [Bacteroidota bacterium]